MDAETRKYIQLEIQRSMNIVLNGLTGEVPTVEQETIKELYPGMDQTQPRPVMHPYGFASKPLADTLSVTVRSGHHVGNRIVIGHRDKVRPDDILQGESVIYASDGETVLRRIDVASDKITIGSKEAEEPLVLGKAWKTHYLAILDQIILFLDKQIATLDGIIPHNHITIGLPSTGPTNSAVFTQLKVDLLKIKVDINKLKADDIDGDVVFSEFNFTEK